MPQNIAITTVWDSVNILVVETKHPFSLMQKKNSACKHKSSAFHSGGGGNTSPVTANVVSSFYEIASLCSIIF